PRRRALRDRRRAGLAGLRRAGAPAHPRCHLARSGRRRPVTDPLTTESVPVLPLEALKPGRCKVVEVDDRWVLLVRVGDEVRATQGLCSHVRTPLGPGRLTKDGLIECPMHGALFSPADGAVLKGPAK